jgi:hypothetical protein
MRCLCGADSYTFPSRRRLSLCRQDVDTHSRASASVRTAGFGRHAHGRHAHGRRAHGRRALGCASASARQEEGSGRRQCNDQRPPGEPRGRAARGQPGPAVAEAKARRRGARARAGRNAQGTSAVRTTAPHPGARARPPAQRLVATAGPDAAVHRRGHAAQRGGQRGRSPSPQEAFLSGRRYVVCLADDLEFLQRQLEQCVRPRVPHVREREHNIAPFSGHGRSANDGWHLGAS